MSALSHWLLSTLPNWKLLWLWRTILWQFRPWLKSTGHSFGWSIFRETLSFQSALAGYFWARNFSQWLWIIHNRISKLYKIFTSSRSFKPTYNRAKAILFERNRIPQSKWIPFSNPLTNQSLKSYLLFWQFCMDWIKLFLINYNLSHSKDSTQLIKYWKMIQSFREELWQ